MTQQTYTVLSIDAWAGDEPQSWDWNAWYDAGEVDRKSTRLNSSHMSESRMPSSA